MICPKMFHQATINLSSISAVNCYEAECAWWRPPVGEGEGACAEVAISEDIEGLLEVLKGVVAAFLAQRKSP